MCDSYCESLIKNRSKQKHKTHLATHMHYVCILLSLQQTIYILIYKVFALYSTLCMVLCNDTKKYVLCSTETSNPSQSLGRITQFQPGMKDIRANWNRYEVFGSKIQSPKQASLHKTPAWHCIDILLQIQLEIN